MSTYYQRDIEKGFVTKTERTLRVLRRALKQRRVLVALVVAWLCYSAVVFGRLAWMRTLAVDTLQPNKIPRNYQLSLAHEANRRYLLVLEEAYDWEVPGLSQPWPHGLRSEFDLMDIDKMLGHLMESNAFLCLAAVHVGVPVQVARVGKVTLTNPRLVSHGDQLVMVQEESAFHPGEFSATERYNSVLVTGAPTGTHQFVGNEAVCAQHLLELF